MGGESINTLCRSSSSPTAITANGVLSVVSVRSSVRLFPLELIKCKGSPYSIAERRVPELIPVLGSQLAGDVSQKPGGRLPLLSARTTVTLATLKRAAANFAAW